MPNKPIASKSLYTRLTLLEQGYLGLAAEQKAGRDKLERIYAYIFGSDDPNEESMKSQVKKIDERIASLTNAFDEYKRESRERQTTYEEQTELNNEQLDTLQRWRKGVEDNKQDNRGQLRQYTFLVISVLFSSAVGYFVAHFLSP